MIALTRANRMKSGPMFAAEDWIDLECGEARVARVAHQRHVWRTWSMLWRVMLVLLVAGYVYNYTHAVLKRRQRLHWLVHDMGEPRECETARRLSRGEGITMDAYFRTWFIDHATVCERYYDELYRLQWVFGLVPSPWGVAVDMVSESIVQPLHHLINVVPLWLLLPCVVVAVLALCLAGAVAPLPLPKLKPQ